IFVHFHKHWLENDKVFATRGGRVWWQQDLYNLLPVSLACSIQMRFGVKPDRPNFLESVRSRYSSSTYKVPSDSENSSNDEYEEEEVFASSDSEDSFIYGSESEIPVKR
ncbi:15972_t:CDS:1, partial [Acaulospora colombiana]